MIISEVTKKQGFPYSLEKPQRSQIDPQTILGETEILERFFLNDLFLF